MTGTGATALATNVVPNGSSPVTATALCASTFALGWHMAQLFGPLPAARVPTPHDRLPSAAELPPEERMVLALAELESLIGKAGLDPGGHSVMKAWMEDRSARLREELKTLNVHLLGQLQKRDERRAAAYQLGRALSDTCWIPDQDRRVEVFLDQFSRHKVATLQTWLGQMSVLAPQAAGIATRSLQNWQDWADANATAVQRNWGGSETPIVDALRTQSRVWHRLLSNDSDLVSQPPMAAWIRAGEAMLQTARTISRKILRRFWPVALVILAAVGGLMYLAITKTGGTTTVWSSLVTVAGGFGVSGASLRAAGKRVATGLEQSAWHAATLDAQAWAVTWLPALRQGPVKRYRLNQRGVAPPVTGRRLARHGPLTPPPPARLPA